MPAILKFNYSKRQQPDNLHAHSPKCEYSCVCGKLPTVAVFQLDYKKVKMSVNISHLAISV